MPALSIDLNSEIYSDIKSRAKRSYLTPEELVYDIIRRSMLSYKKKPLVPPLKADDPLVGVFSRQRTGRKPKPKKKK